MIEIKGINKIYNPEKDEPLKALKDINLKFDLGECVCIFGKSGSGKSTLLNIIAGLDKSTTGDVFIRDEKLGQFNHTEISDFRRKDVGFIFQDFQLLDHLTVLENTELGLSMDSIEKKDRRVKALDILEKLGLSEHSNHKPNELSGGQKQRVSIARALVKEPDIIIADEPTGALDSQTSDDIMALLREISQEGKLVIIVTHDEEFKNYASRLITLKDGAVIEDLNRSDSLIIEKASRRESRRKFNLSSAFALSLKRLYERRWRYALVSISMIIGICALAVAFGLSRGIDSYITHANNKIIDNKKLSLSKKEEFDSDDYFDINHNDEVRFAQSEFLMNVKAEVNDEITEFNVKSIVQDEYKGEYTTPQIVHGRMPIDGKNEIAVSEDIAKSLYPEEDIESIVGKDLDMKFLAKDELSNYPSRWDKQTMKITGIVEKSLIDENFAYIPHDVHLNIAARSRFISKNEEVPTNNISVYLKDSDYVEDFYNKYKRKYDIVRPIDRLAGLTDMFKNFNLLVLGGAVLILVISALMIGIIIFISVLERQKEIGILVSIGGRRMDIQNIFVAEGILLGAVSSVAGVGISILFSIIINPLALKYMNYKIFKPDLVTVASSIILGVLISFVASVLPATKASRLSPIELLRRN